MKPLTTIDSQMVCLPTNDIDTDQIIPARYLKTTDKLGLSKGLFANWRYLEDGSDNSEFILNQDAMHGRQILLAGDNFGCGSSREHAPWALGGWGFRVVISTSFADIFRNNALKNGLLLLTVAQEDHDRLMSEWTTAPNTQAAVDLPAQTLTLSSGAQYSFPIDAFSKRCLVEGMDQLAYLLSFDEAISSFEEGR